MSGFATETFSAATATPDLALTAGVHEDAVTAFRAGVPSWRLEQPGVIESLAKATGTDANLIRANVSAAKVKAQGQRAHATGGPATFPGQTYPSLRS